MENPSIMPLLSFQHLLESYFLCPATKKWRVIMLYPLKYWVSVCPYVRPSAPPPFFWCNSSYRFRPIIFKLYRPFRMVWRYAYCFFRILKLFFITFFAFLTDFFRALILQKCIGSMYLLPATPPTILGQSFSNFTVPFKMVWRYAYCFFRILKLFFITFFAFLT